MVISDCIYGARLRIEYLPEKSGNADELAKQFVTHIQRTRRRFSTGIEQIVGVMPFVSTNLSHDFDHLQAGYGHLLESALIKLPGVAVIEVEEARIINRELQRTGGELKRRVVSIFVNGEFKMSTTTGENGPRISVAIRVVGQQKTLHQEDRTNQTSDEVIELLSVGLPRTIARLARRDSDPVFSRKLQQEMLVARANRFFERGMWQQASGLREAAVLLGPNQVVQRLNLAFEYHKIYSVPGLWIVNRNSKADSSMRLGPLRTRTMAYLATLPHVEYMIRNRQVDRGLALELLGGRVIHGLTVGMPVAQISREEKQILHVAEDAQIALVPKLVPLIAKLPQSMPNNPAIEKWRFSNLHRRNDDRFAESLGGNAVAAVTSRMDRDFYTPEDLVDLYRMLHDVVGKNGLSVSQISYGMFAKAPTSARRVRDATEATEQQWIAMLRKLKDSRYTVTKMHGIHGLLEVRKGIKPSEKEAIAREGILWLDRFQKGELTELQPKHLFYGHARSSIRRLARALRRRCVFSLPEEERPAPKVFAARPPDKPRVKPPPKPLNRLRFLRIDLKAQSNTGSLRPFDGSLRGLTACGEDLDAAWTDHAIWLMRHKGIFEEVLVDADEKFTGVHWDGRSIWAVGIHKGIVVLNTSGRVLGRIDRKQGLPPHDKKLLIQPITPGQCVAVGQFGTLGRAWCAIIEQAKSQKDFSLHVIHEATQLPRKANHLTPDDPRLVFEPIALHLCDTLVDGHRILYVHRRERYGYAGVWPLAIDLTTRKAWIVKEPFLDARRSIYIQWHRSSTAWPKSRRAIEFHISHWEVMDRDWPDGKPRLCHGASSGKGLPYYDGWFYSATYGACKRMKADTWEFEYLQPTEKVRHYAVSAHYGPVGWIGRRFYRLTVDDVRSDDRPVLEKVGTQGDGTQGDGTQEGTQSP